jgi:alpha-mannosidase
MEENDYYLVRVNELSGKNQKNVKLVFPSKIADAYEVNGQEKKIGEAGVSGDVINFDLSHYTIRSFAVKLQSADLKNEEEPQQAVELPYNTDVMSYDTNRDDGRFSDGQSLPDELIPDTIESEGIRFAIHNKADGKNNAVCCMGQTIDLPRGNYSKLYVLAAADDDTEGLFTVGNDTITLPVQSWTGRVGEFYNRILSRDENSVVEMESPFSKTDNIAWFASHVHNAYPSHNQAYQYGYLYKYEISIPDGAKTITLPDNKRIKVLALSVGKSNSENVISLQPLYDNFKGNPKFVLRP